MTDSIASHGNDHTGEFAKCKVHASLRRAHSIKQLGISQGNLLTSDGVLFVCQVNLWEVGRC